MFVLKTNTAFGGRIFLKKNFMQIQVFNISVFDNGEQTEDLNKFLRSHSIIDMEKQLISDGQTPFWTFCIRYKESSKINPQTKSKIDYKEILDEAVFKVFSLLRTYRKKLAEQNGVPVYAVFTNEELANIAKLDEINIENMKKINGIGSKKIEKYGEPILNLYLSETQ